MENITNEKLFRNAVFSIPLYFLSIVPFLFVARILDIDISIGIFLLGALGWWIALILRLPIILLINKSIKDVSKSSKYIVGLSGPAEELVRLVILLIIGLNLDNAYALGLGWAFIEIIYGLIQLFGIVTLKSRTDKKSLDAKEMMKKMGMEKTFESNTPYWGALERVSATALHISFGLFIVISPLLIMLTMPLHSLVNFAVLKINKISIAKSQLTFITFSVALFTGLIYIVS